MPNFYKKKIESMLHFLKKQLAKYKQARQGVLEYGSEVKTFEIDGIGKVEFAQHW